jgi:hypothetical protein
MDCSDGKFAAESAASEKPQALANAAKLVPQPPNQVFRRSSLADVRA